MAQAVEGPETVPGDRRDVIARRLEVLEKPFIGTITAQWVQIGQRLLRRTLDTEAAELAHQWTESQEGASLAEFVGRICIESRAPEDLIQLVTFQFQPDATVAEASHFTRVLTPDADVVKRRGVVDIRLPGQRAESTPSPRDLRLTPPVQMIRDSERCSLTGDRVTFERLSSTGTVLSTLQADDQGFIYSWATRPDHQLRPTRISYQGAPIPVLDGYFPRRSARMSFRKGELDLITVYEILEVREGMIEESATTAVPERTTVIDARPSGLPKSVVTQRKVEDWRDAFDPEKNPPAGKPQKNSQFLSLAMLNLVALILFVPLALRIWGLRKRKEK